MAAGFFLLCSLAASSSEDMSILSFNVEHGVEGLESTEEEIRMLYDGWRAKHGRIINALGEEDHRFEIFKGNLRFVDAHNVATAAGRHTCWLGLNGFADLTNDECRATFLGTRPHGGTSNRVAGNRYRYRDGEELPESVDWRANGAVSAVKDQGSCGNIHRKVRDSAGPWCCSRRLWH